MQGRVIKRCVKLLIALGFHYFERTVALFQSRSDKPGACVVLMYHDVTPENCGRFIQQMEILPRLAIPVAIDAIGVIKNGRHHVAVTFDDGFAPTIDLVVPILRQRAIPAAFFIPTAHLGREAAWITDKDKRKLAGPIITAENLQLLGKGKGVTIGSHGMNHRRLTEMKDEDARKELAESKRQLENITGTKVKAHSFPYGAYEDRHIVMARKAGYDHVYTVDPTMATGAVEEFVVGRVQVEPTDWPLEFKLKVLGAYRWHPYVSRLKRFLWHPHEQ